jgi:hypothetical protein
MDPRRRWLQDLANWDPVYPGERVSWYDEYIHRHGRATVNWMQQPRYSAPDGEPGALFATVETDVRGAALFRENVTRPGPVMAVAPVDDGSVYLWDVSGDRGARGSVIARSKIGLLFGDTKPTASTARSHRIDSGVAESVSVCHQLGVAFIAVQSRECAPLFFFLFHNSSNTLVMLTTHQNSSPSTSGGWKSSTTTPFPRPSHASRTPTSECPSASARRAVSVSTTTATVSAPPSPTPTASASPPCRQRRS